MLLAGRPIACLAVASVGFPVDRTKKQNLGKRSNDEAVSCTWGHAQLFTLRSSELGREQSQKRIMVASAAAPSNSLNHVNSKEALGSPATIAEASERFKHFGEDDELPEHYIEREQDRPRLRYDEYSKEGTTIPVLDFALVESDRALAVKILAEACTEWGFFHLINHGVPREVLDEVEAQAFRFFHLPTERKKASGKCSTTRGNHYTGDSTFEQKSSLQWAECLRLMGPDTRGIAEWSGRVWQDGDHAFRDVTIKYIAMVDSIFKTLLELLAEGLGLKTNYFTQFVTKKRATAINWNYYPRCPQPDKILGTRPHTDGCSMTILRTSEVGGLQLQKDQEWVPVRPISDGLVVNMGDALQAWTNGIYKSVLHRVVANSVADRMSLACFMNVDSDHLISAPDELIDDEHPRLYRPYKFMDYAMHVHNSRANDPYAERDGRLVLEGFRLGNEKKPERFLP